MTEVMDEPRPDGGPRTAPGPSGHFLMGRLSSFRNDSLGMLVEIQQEFGGVSQVRLGPFTVHQVTDGDAIYRVLQENNRNYVRGKLYRGFRLFMGTGMLTTDGDRWSTRRQISQPLFRPSNLHDKAGIINDCAEAIARGWEGPADRGEAVDVVPDMLRLSIGVISRMLFGIDLSDRADEIAPVVRFAIKSMILTGKLEQALPRWIPTRYQRNLKSSRLKLRALMDEVIQRHRRGEGRADDLVSALLAARDEETGEPWPDRRIQDELSTMFLAGHETTGCALSWTLYAIASHPDVRRRLEAELDQELGERTASIDDLPRLVYLRQVVEESLRLYPPIWLFPRDAVDDDELGGYHVPAGGTLLLSPYAAHRAPDVWTNPEAFDPDRFSPDCPHAGHDRYSYFPFGGGARQCVGMRLALVELQLSIAILTQRYRYDLVPGQSIRPTALVSLRPQPGINMLLTRKVAPCATP